MFGKKDNQANERVIYQAKPNIILGCKKAIFGVILLIIVLFVSSPIIQFIGKMQVYLISRIQLPLTRYSAIALFVLMLVIIFYIIWQIIGWYAKEYILTDSKVIVKSGVLFTRKNYMPYATIQDINTSQSIFARLLNVGSVSVYSAYDNNQISIENVSNPSKVEEIIFSRIARPRAYYQPHRQTLNNRYPTNDEYYDDGVITPIGHEENYNRREYDYYPEDLNYNNVQRPKYEYEPYSGSLEQEISRAMNSPNQEYPNTYQRDGYYDEMPKQYSHSNDDYYQYNEEESFYNEDSIKSHESQKDDVDESSENVIKRHFDKFKK